MGRQNFARRSTLRCLWLMGALAGTPLAAQAQEATTYTYDALGRLVATNTNGGPNNGVVMGTCFDAAGNRTQYVVTTGGLPTCATQISNLPRPPIRSSRASVAQGR
jgi:YD repeat-containing protein